jgi:hypothetical protein
MSSILKISLRRGDVRVAKYNCPYFDCQQPIRVKEVASTFEKRRVACPTCDGIAVLSENLGEALTRKAHKMNEVTAKEKLRRKCLSDLEMTKDMQDDEDRSPGVTGRNIVYIHKYVQKVAPKKQNDKGTIILQNADGKTAIAAAVPCIRTQPPSNPVSIPNGYISSSNKSHNTRAAESGTEDKIACTADIPFASDQCERNPSAGVIRRVGGCAFVDEINKSHRIMGRQPDSPVISDETTDKGTMYRNTATLGEDMICRAVQAKNDGKFWLYPREFQLVHALKHVARNRNVHTGVYNDPSAQEHGQNRFENTHILEIRGWLRCIQELANQRQHFVSLAQARDGHSKQRQPSSRDGAQSLSNREIRRDVLG